MADTPASRGANAGVGPTAAPTLPLKTPMYEAIHAERYQRQAHIRAIQGANRTLICYVAGIKAPITRDDSMGIMELLHNVPNNSDVDFLLHTGGGDIDAAEKLIGLIRAVVGTGTLRVIVPDFAKSAGTLIAIGADRIVMSDSSELGPIDPQITLGDGRGNAIPHSVMSYLEAFEEHAEALRKNPNDVVAQIMLNKLEPPTVKLFAAARTRAQKLAETHLQQWMQLTNFTAPAEKLMDTKRWLTHGQMIGYQAAQSELSLKVEYLPIKSPEWRAYWSLYCLQRLAVKDNQKLYESACASLQIDGSI
jgi:membrane-bound ClpP family serine protease